MTSAFTLQQFIDFTNVNDIYFPVQTLCENNMQKIIIFKNNIFSLLLEDKELKSKLYNEFTSGEKNSLISYQELDNIGNGQTVDRRLTRGNGKRLRPIDFLASIYYFYSTPIEIDNEYHPRFDYFDKKYFIIRFTSLNVNLSLTIS